MEILKVENLCKQYGKGENKVTALDNVSFTVNKGEFVAIVGASGSGNSASGSDPSSTGPGTSTGTSQGENTGGPGGSNVTIVR